MIQKCSLIATLSVFLKEPTKLHFIREISREINLAHTSVKKHIKTLLKEDLIRIKQNKPFNGYVSNRDSEKFILYKKAFNILSLEQVLSKINEEIAPKVIVLFGSYEKGEDIEESDIDLLLISNVKKELEFSKEEKTLKRNIHITIVKKLSELDKPLRNNVIKGTILEGDLDV